MPRLTPEEIDARTPPDRCRYADVLRVASILVVVFGHWLVLVVTVREGKVVFDTVFAAASSRSPFRLGDPEVSWVIFRFRLGQDTGVARLVEVRAYRGSEQGKGRACQRRQDVGRHPRSRSNRALTWILDTSRARGAPWRVRREEGARNVAVARQRYRFASTLQWAAPRPHRQSLRLDLRGRVFFASGEREGTCGRGAQPRLRKRYRALPPSWAR